MYAWQGLYIFLCFGKTVFHVTQVGYVNAVFLGDGNSLLR